MLAISTSWNYKPGCSVKNKLLAIKKIGFNAIELSYNFTPRALSEFISLSKIMDLKVVSVHNFCPLPLRGHLRRFFTDYYRLSSLHERERKRAVELTKASIDTARRLSCGVLVIHAGRVELDAKFTKQLLHLYRRGSCRSNEYLRLRDRFLALRQAKKGRYLDAVKKSLQDILAYARSAGVKIGLETRYYPQEIPDFEETAHLLRIFGDKGLVYWHDVGHAEVNERLGITPHTDFLKSFFTYLHGVHIHDLRGIDDHKAPFSGDLDFSKIASYLRDSGLNGKNNSRGGLIRVIEAHPPATPAQIKKSIETLSRLIGKVPPQQAGKCTLLGGHFPS